ncbi:MAG: DUF1203 domain-containing protein [Gemmatimonadetes bacterium]|nr:DUF1203 domain-containing protein [Gemmatimonadota bacterium]
MAQEWVGESAAEAVIEGVFRETTAAFVHLRNAEAGCFMARVERCFDCD